MWKPMISKLNSYRTEGDTAYIKIASKNGVHERVMKIDLRHFDYFRTKKIYFSYGRDGKPAYAVIWEKKRVYTHRKVIELEYGEIKKKRVVDHMFHDTFDNRVAFLRVLNYSLNTIFKKRRVLGVNYKPRRFAWVVSFQYKNERFYKAFKLAEFGDAALSLAIKHRRDLEEKYLHNFVYEELFA